MDYCFQDIKLCQKAITIGLVHKIFVNSSHSEEYDDFIPSICAQRVRAYASRRQSNFFFRIWAICEERQYLKLYPSVQLWELHAQNYIPTDPCEKLPILDLDKEIHQVAKDFFTETYTQGTSSVHSVHIDGNILFYDYISAFDSPEIKVPKVLEFLAGLQLGKKGMKVKEEFYTELDAKGDNMEEEDRNQGDDALDEDALQNIALDD